MFLWIKAFHLVAVVTWFAALFLSTQTICISRNDRHKRYHWDRAFQSHGKKTLERDNDAFDDRCHRSRNLDDLAGTRLYDPRVDACQTHICGLVDWVPPLVYKNRQNVQK